MESATKAAKQQEALENMGQATAIITNPTHFAIALKYEVGQIGAPKIPKFQFRSTNSLSK